jgi:hypothetical protein
LPRIALTLYLDPGEAEALIRVRNNEDNVERFPAMIDTGAQTCLFPITLLDSVPHEITDRERFTIEQAGIAGQAFSALEATIEIVIEDALGNESPPLKVRAWFAETSLSLIGFDGILDRATLYLDMRETRTGWMEFND